MRREIKPRQHVWIWQREEKKTLIIHCCVIITFDVHNLYANLFLLKLDGNESDSYHEKVSGRFHLVELTRFSLDGHFPPTWKPTINYKAEAKINNKNVQHENAISKAERSSISCLHVKIRYFIHLSKSPQLHYCLSRAALASTWL